MSLSVQQVQSSFHARQVKRSLSDRFLGSLVNVVGKQYASSSDNWLIIAYIEEHRLNPPDPRKLHRKIEEMGQRIRQLEDALSSLQASRSSERHPLLRDEYLSIKLPLNPFEGSNVEEDVVPTEVVDLVDACGTLTLNEEGHARYLGRTAGSEVCV